MLLTSHALKSTFAFVGRDKSDIKLLLIKTKAMKHWGNKWGIVDSQIVCLFLFLLVLLFMEYDGEKQN